MYPLNTWQFCQLYLDKIEGEKVIFEISSFKATGDVKQAVIYTDLELREETLTR